MNNQRAFTLIELAIVLVIIGLLVGGVMVGKDLITGGEVSKQTAQISQYRTAVNSFRDKYHGLPGDLKAQTANGFQMIARSGAAGHGDGNGRIEGCAANATNAGCETALFWTDLSFAGLISPTLDAATDAPVQMTSIVASMQPQQPSQDWQQLLASNMPSMSLIADAQAIPIMPPDMTCEIGCICVDPDTGESYDAPASPDCDCNGVCDGGGGGAEGGGGAGGNSKERYLPQAALGDNSVTVYTDGSSNYFQIAGVVSTDAAGVYTLRNALSPKDALSIDTKLDDATPLTGSVRAVGGTGPLGVAALPGAGNCVATTAGNPYNTATDDLATAPLCQISLRTQ